VSSYTLPPVYPHTALYLHAPPVSEKRPMTQSTPRHDDPTGRPRANARRRRADCRSTRDAEDGLAPAGATATQAGAVTGHPVDSLLAHAVAWGAPVEPLCRDREPSFP